MRYVALLRGINVGGNRKVPMADLKRTFERAGFAEVRTYIQSGNVVFMSDGADEDATRETVEAAIERDFGFPVQVVLRSREEWDAAIAANPFPGREEYLHVAFLAAPLPQAAQPALDASASGGEEWRAVGRELYLFLPAGSGNSKLAAAMTERKLGVLPTVRNWRTVLALRDMLVS